MNYLIQRDFDGLIQVIQSLREWISDWKDPLPGSVINEMGMTSSLLNLLSDNFSDQQRLQTEVAWFLANLSAGTSKDTRVLVEMNIIPVMARALGSTVNDDLDENVKIIKGKLFSLGNI